MSLAGEIILTSTTLAPLQKKKENPKTTKITAAMVAPVLLHRSSSGIDYSAFQSKTLDDYHSSSSTASSASELDLSGYIEHDLLSRTSSISLYDLEREEENSSLDDQEQPQQQLCSKDCTVESVVERKEEKSRARRLSFFQRIWNADDGHE